MFKPCSTLEEKTLSWKVLPEGQNILFHKEAWWAWKHRLHCSAIISQQNYQSCLKLLGNCPQTGRASSADLNGKRIGRHVDTFYLKYFTNKTNRSFLFEKDSYLHRTEHSVGIPIINNYPHRSINWSAPLLFYIEIISSITDWRHLRKVPGKCYAI